MSPDAADVAARLRSEGLDPSTWSNGPGDRYAAHEHGYDKVIAVDSGSIDFELPASGEVISLAAGDRLELPARTLHAAVVGQAAVTCWEAHLVAGGFSADAPDARTGSGSRVANATNAVTSRNLRADPDVSRE